MTVPRFPNSWELEARMRPGQYSSVGFLGAADRLDEVRHHDEQVMARLGCTAEQVAAALESVIGEIDFCPMRSPRLVGPFEVRLTRYRGPQTCPWSANEEPDECNVGGDGLASIDWHITNAHTGLAMSGPGLAVHLIRDHHFFEGPGSPYRVDPEKLVRLLGL